MLISLVTGGRLFMKRNYKVVLIVLSLTLTACSPGSYHKQKESLEFEKEYLTFEDAVAQSDLAITGEFIEMVEHENYMEYAFKVIDCMYGDITDDIIYLYCNLGTGYVSEIDYEYDLNHIVYEKGKDYILILEKQESLMYDHDRYMQTADLVLCEENNEYTMYSQQIEIPEYATIIGYIRSLPNKSTSIEIDYDNVYEENNDEKAEDPIYAGEVTILSLEIEGIVHNGNTYKCSVNNLTQGQNLNAYEDGTILIVILKNTVQVGSTYFMEFSPVAKDSLIYTQISKDEIYEID